MPVDASKIRIAGTGTIWKAPVGTTAPTDSTSALAAGWVNLGYAEDGFEFSNELKTKDVEAWQTLEIVRKIPVSLTRSVSWKSLETNKETVSLAWNGATITPGSAGAYTMTIPSSYVGTEFSLVVDWSDGTISQRIYIPRAALASLPKIGAGRKDALAYDFEVAVVAPADGSASVQVFGKDAGVAS